MPTTRAASTPSRRAMRKAESTETPVENDLQQRFQFKPPLSCRQVDGACQIFPHPTVEWELASNALYEISPPSTTSCDFPLLVFGLPAIDCSGRPEIVRCRGFARAGQAGRETRQEARGTGLKARGSGILRRGSGRL